MLLVGLDDIYIVRLLQSCVFVCHLPLDHCTQKTRDSVTDVDFTIGTMKVTIFRGLDKYFSSLKENCIETHSQFKGYIQCPVEILKINFQ